MSFTFKVEGDINHLYFEMKEIEFKASEEGIDPGHIQIVKDHLFDPEPYILVTCQDEQKGKELLNRVERQAPRFTPHTGTV
jgi:hypothetical protein